MSLAKANGVRSLRVRGDSKLVVNHLRKKGAKVSWTLEDKLNRAKTLTKAFLRCHVQHIKREVNQVADLMANLDACLSSHVLISFTFSTAVLGDARHMKGSLT